MKIFDFHLHPRYDFDRDTLPYERTDERFVSDLKKDGICRCAGSVIHIDDAYKDVAAYGEIVPRLNAEAYEFFRLYPDFFVPGIHIHWEHAELSYNQILYYADKGVKLVGELVPYMMGGAYYSDPRLIEILRVAADKGMVLSMHPHLKHPDDMEGLIRALPHMPIVMAHLDGYGLYDWSIDMMKKYDNLYFDISAHGVDRKGMLKDAVQKVGASRILYGSDYPGYDSAPFINAVCEAGLTEKEQEAIFFENAASLLL